MLFKRISSVVAILSICANLVACGPSKQLQSLQAEYIRLKQAPIQSTYAYNLSKPFTLNGKLVTTSQQLAETLQSRPSTVIAVAPKEPYADSLVENDMKMAGYVCLGKKKAKGGATELVFSPDQNNAPALQARQQQLQGLEAQIRQQEAADAQANQQYATIAVGVGVPALMMIGSYLLSRSNN